MPPKKNSKTGKNRKKSTTKRGRYSKNRTYRSSNTQSVVSSVGKGKKKQTLAKRVANLEDIQQKHFDNCSSPLDPLQTIEYNGITYAGAPVNNYRNCFKNFLAIQGMGKVAVGGGGGNTPTMPTYSGRFAANENNVRIGDSCYVQWARLRGVIQAKQPAGLQVFTPSATAGTATQMSDTAAQGDVQTTVWLVILRDKRPSLVGPNGTSTPNPQWDGTAGQRPMDSLSAVDRTGNISLAAHGFTNFLRSYKSERFAIHYKKAYTLTALKPRQFIDVKVKINKELKYQSVDLANNNNGQPLNYNLYAYLVQDQIADMTGVNMEKPVLVNWTSRTYFRDA